MVISAATGAVGSAFAALAKARGCRVVGIAGGPDKCTYAVDELGYDACIDYKVHADAASLSKALKKLQVRVHPIHRRTHAHACQLRGIEIDRDNALRPFG